MLRAAESDTDIDKERRQIEDLSYIHTDGSRDPRPGKNL